MSIQRPIPLEAWRTGGATMMYKGHKIFTRSAGVQDGPILLLIHGFPTASWDWEAIWPSLTARYRVVTLDMLGFGFSAKPCQYPYSINDQADLYEAFLIAEHISEYHVLAHDYGDTVAQELLARQDESITRPRMQSLALLNGGLFPETHRPLFMQKLLLSPFGPWIALLTNKARFCGNMRSIFGNATQPDDMLLDGFWDLLTYNDGVRVLPRLIHYIIERRQNRARWVGALQYAQIPLKLINGADDPISGRHMAHRYRELVPQPDISLLEGIGHYPQCEAPLAVLESYWAFRDAG